MRALDNQFKRFKLIGAWESHMKYYAGKYTVSIGSVYYCMQYKDTVSSSPISSIYTDVYVVSFWKQGKIHRIGKPAYYMPIKNYKSFQHNGYLHNPNGAARYWKDQSVEYYYKGKYFKNIPSDEYWRKYCKLLAFS